VTWLDENLLGLSEIPPFNGSFSLNFHLSLIELLLPLIKHCNSLVNYENCLFRFCSKNALDIDLASNFVTNFIGNALQEVFHLSFVLVYVS